MNMRLVGNSGFTEGWARYAEALAEEAGLYSTAYARANRRLWPSRGMVVDPGIHLFGWTREQAERELGARFDLRAFHDTVLGNGAITLPMLRQKVESWIRRSRTRS